MPSTSHTPSDSGGFLVDSMRPSAAPSYHNGPLAVVAGAGSARRELSPTASPT